MDFTGKLLKALPSFRGRGRLVQRWLKRRGPNDRRVRTLPGGAWLQCDLSIPYEAMVWLEEEEERDLRVLQRLLEPGQVFVDCGANIGTWTLVAASALRGSGRVLSFEPNPATFAKLSEHIAANGLNEAVELFNSACGAQRATLPFRCDTEHNRSQIDASASVGSVQVRVVALDEVLSGQTVHGIKVDVEGFEYAVLKGCENTLRAWRPWLCVEFNTLLAGVNRLGAWRAHELLCALGYHCWPFAEALAPTPDRRLGGDWVTSGYCNLFYHAD